MKLRQLTKNKKDEKFKFGYDNSYIFARKTNAYRQSLVLGIFYSS